MIGAGFGVGSAIPRNGVARTTLVDSMTLRATLTQAHVQSPGDVRISVSDSSLPAATLRVRQLAARVYLPFADRP